jgi:hypothetical protein
MHWITTAFMIGTAIFLFYAGYTVLELARSIVP